MKEETYSPSDHTHDRLQAGESEFDEAFRKRYGETQMNKRRKRQQDRMEAFNSKREDYKKEDLSFHGPGYGSSLFNL